MRVGLTRANVCPNVAPYWISFASTILLTQEKKRRSGSSQEIKFQGPEDTKRRVKKEVNQVDRNN